MIKHDRSSTSILTTCTDCDGVWFSFSFTMDGDDGARARGERHEVSVHGRDPREASNARRSAAKRTRRAASLVK